MHLTILKKGLLLIAVPLLFQFIFIAILVRATSVAAEVEELVMHTKDVLVQGEIAYGQIVGAQTAIRGFLISNDPMFADEAVRSADTALTSFAALEALVDNDLQQQRAKEIVASAGRLADMVRTIDAAQRSGGIDPVSRSDIVRQGAQRLEDLRGRLNEFMREETRVEASRLEQLRQAREAQHWVTGGGIFGATLVTCFVAYLFSRSISRRIGVVIDNAGALAENQPLADRLRGGDEIAALDAAMHETARRLSDSADSERRFKAEIEKRASALALANENLRQQTQENEMFVYSVSHDLRSPLVNLQGFSQELSHAGQDLRRLLNDERVPPDVRTRVEQVLENDVVDSVRFIQSAVTRSASIIDALLRLSRAGRVEYRPQQVDVLTIVRRIVDAMTNTIESRKAQIKVPLVLPSCWGDPTAIEQVLGNLVGNAVNYLDPRRPGLVEIGLATESNVLREGMHTYYVRDNGLGIPAAYLGKVFVAFQRLHGDVAKGEGIGLALVRRVVERHGGEVWVESAEGVGTTFYLALPERDPATRNKKPEEPAPAARSEPKAGGSTQTEHGNPTRAHHPD